MFHKISNLILQTTVHGICDFTSVSMTYVLCPTEEKLGMLMSSVIANVCMCGGVGEKVGVEVREVAEKGQLILSIGPARAEVRILVQRATTPRKRLFFMFVKTPHMH
jgi:hypothetical protein